MKLGEAGRSNFIDSFSVMQTDQSDERMKKTAACRLQHQARGLRGVLIPLNPVRLERPLPRRVLETQRGLLTLFLDGHRISSLRLIVS